MTETLLSQGASWATAIEPLAPVQRFRLRAALQDRWREQVQCLTELAVLLHSAGSKEMATESAPGVPVPVAVSSVRLRIAEIEQAMRRLDDGSYGRCGHCGSAMPFDWLLNEPATISCADCIRDVVDRHVG